MRRLAAVVLNYGTPEPTLRAVRALRASRRAPDAVIVVDNGSTDDSAARLGALDPPVTLLAIGRNLGFSGGNNAGIREALARGADLVLLVNSDVVVEPECVGRLEAALAAPGDAGIAGPVVRFQSDPARVMSAGIRYSPGTGRIRDGGFGRPFDGWPRAVRTADAVSGCAMLVRREVLERVGLLCEEYFFSFEDVDFCLRARAAGFRTVCVGAAAARHEGSRSIGRRSPSRLYFATRNHLLLAARVGPPAGRWRVLVRSGAILALNLGYALFRAEAPRLAGVLGVVQGAWHHARGRYGDRPASPSA